MTDPDPTPSADELLKQAAFVRSVARATLKSEDLVDDVVQDTWLSALTKPARLRGTLRGWLAAVTRSRAIDAMRRESALRRRESRAVRSERVASADEIAARAETGRHLVKTVLALEEPYRTTILLRFYDGLSRREVAARMGVPPETVHTRLRRGLAQLRARLTAEYGDRAGGWKAVIGPLVTAPAGASLLAGATYGAATVMTKKILVGSLVLAALAVGTAVVVGLPSAEVAPRTDSSPPEVLTAAAPVPDPEPPAVSEPPTPPEPAPGPAPTPAEEPPSAPEVAEPEPTPGPEPTNAGPTLEGSPQAGEEEPDPPAEPAVAEAGAWDVDLDRDLHGEVVREDGTPVVGATLTTVTTPWAMPRFMGRGDWGAGQVPGPSATSDERGRFVIRLTPSQVVRLEVAAEGLPRFGLRDVQAGGRVRVVLRDPVRLVVELKGAGGQVPSGVPVTLYAGSSTGFHLKREEKADDEGRIAFDGLPPGLQVTASARGMHDKWGAVYERVVLPESGEQTLRLRVPLGRTIKGRVVDRASRAPIEGARVYWLSDRDVYTDEDGRYVLHGWTGGPYRYVTAYADGYVRAQDSIGRRQVIDFALERGARVTGRLIDAQGAPVAGARLSATAFSETRTAVQRLDSLDSATSGADGRFVLDGLTPGTENTLRIVALGYGRVIRDLPAVAAGEPLDLGDIHLAAASSIRARITTSLGEPVVRQRAYLMLPDPKGRVHSHVQCARGWTDGRGAVWFTGLVPGRYVVRVAIRRWPNFAKVVEVSDEGTVVEVDLCTGTRPLTVRVVDDLGEPVPRAYFYAYDFDVASRPMDQVATSGMTDDRGVARVEVRPDVPIGVWVSAERAGPYARHKTSQYAPDVEEITVVLERTDVLTGSLLDPEGNPIAYGNLEIHGASAEPQRVVTGEDGSFRARVEDKDPVTIRFQGLVGFEALEPLVCRPWSAIRKSVLPTARDVVLRAQPVSTDRRLEIRVLDPDGSPVAGVAVRLDVHEDGRPTDDSGRVVFEGLPALPLEIHVEYAPTRDRPWTVAAAGRVVPDGQSVDVQLIRGAVFRGRAFLPDGAACTGGTVTARWVSPPPEKMLSHGVPIESDGRFLVVLDPSVKGRVLLEAESVDPSGARCKGTAGWIDPNGEDVELRLEAAED